MKGLKKSALAMAVFAMFAVATAGTIARADAGPVTVTITSPGDGDHVFNATWADAANPVLVAAGQTTLVDSIFKGTSSGAASIAIDLSNHGQVKRGDYHGTVTPNADGTWSFDPGLLLPDTYTATVTATDSTGANTAVAVIQIAVIA